MVVSKGTSLLARAVSGAGEALPYTLLSSVVCLLALGSVYPLALLGAVALLAFQGFHRLYFGKSVVGADRSIGRASVDAALLLVHTVCMLLPVFLFLSSGNSPDFWFLPADAVPPELASPGDPKSFNGEFLKKTLEGLPRPLNDGRVFCLALALLAFQAILFIYGVGVTAGAQGCLAATSGESAAETVATVAQSAAETAATVAQSVIQSAAPHSLPGSTPRVPR
jgi:hypothetical protein